MANSSDPLPSIPTNLNKLHRIYSDSEERNIEKTILYVVFDAENKPRPYLYIDPDGGDVPENRVDCITLAELFKNGLLISIKNSFVLETTNFTLPFLLLCHRTFPTTQLCSVFLLL